MLRFKMRDDLFHAHHTAEPTSSRSLRGAQESDCTAHCVLNCRVALHFGNERFLNAARCALMNSVLASESRGVFALAQRRSVRRRVDALLCAFFSLQICTAFVEKKREILLEKHTTSRFRGARGGGSLTGHGRAGGRVRDCCRAEREKLKMLSRHSNHATECGDGRM